jgi:nitroreductase
MDRNDLRSTADQEEKWMDILEIMKARCSVRKFEDRRIDKADLEYVLEAARVAPSACNLQPWRFVIIDTDSGKKRLHCTEWIKNAPAVIVACGLHTEAWKRQDGKDHTDIDVAIAVDHITLAAAARGMGTCWVCWFDASGTARSLGLPRDVEPVALIPIGYPAESSSPDRHASERKSLSAITSWNTYSR